MQLGVVVHNTPLIPTETGRPLRILSDVHSERISQDCEVGPCFKEEEEGKKKFQLFSLMIYNKCLVKESK